MVDLVIGHVYWTPFEPAGRVRLLEIEPGDYFGHQTVFVEYVENHCGHKAGTFGRYLADELREERG